MNPSIGPVSGFLWFVGSHFAPQTVWVTFTLVNSVVLSNTSSSSISRQRSDGPIVDNDRLSAIVPSAFRIGVHNGGCSGAHCSSTRPLEIPSHGSIVRFRREVRSGIAISTFRPSLAFINNDTFWGGRNDNRGKISFLVCGSRVIDRRASATNISKATKAGCLGWSNSSITMSNEGPSEFGTVSGFVLGAVFR